MSLRSKDTAIDEIVASCHGDLRGAVRALLLINEHLEKIPDQVKALTEKVEGRDI